MVENWNTKEALDTQFIDRLETTIENEVKKIVGQVLKKFSMIIKQMLRVLMNLLDLHILTYGKG